MRIVIIYGDGTVEQVPLALRGGVVSEGRRWIPGHVVEKEPERCPVGSDYFSAAIDEGGERSGEFRPDREETDPETGVSDREGFRWEVVGSDEEECRAKLLRWAKALGPGMNPYEAGAAHFKDGVLRILDDAEASEFDADMQCCLFHLDDVEGEASTALEEAGFPAISTPRF